MRLSISKTRHAVLSEMLILEGFEDTRVPNLPSLQKKLAQSLVKLSTMRTHPL